MNDKKMEQIEIPSKISLIRRSSNIKTFYETLDINEDDFVKEIINNSDSNQILYNFYKGKRFGTNVRTIIVNFENVLFEEKDFNLIRTIMLGSVDFEGKKIAIDGNFKNCKFNVPIFIDNSIEAELWFENCIFSRDILLKGTITGGIKFFKCEFDKLFDLENTEITNIFDIAKSLFGERSFVKLSNTKVKHLGKLCIKNTQFIGKFEATNLALSSYANFKNISFFNIVDISNIQLNGMCFFENIAFGNPASPMMIEAQKELAKALEQWGHKKEIANLGLNIAQNIDDTEEREYQDALQKGWLNPKQAARFLGKSVRTLQEKRKNDQMQITKESLPFIGEGKDILYPLDALKAYLEQDWNLLKELRKKHWKK
ncbi:MAG: helix-turn-helix domain-containing protein [Alphaproteobacteria bacterium]|nr:helix-turn-helix domain-containing protein [Alphaproteobacteria bacterium]